MYLRPEQLSQLCGYRSSAAAISLYIYSAPEERLEQFHNRLNRLETAVDEKVDTFQGSVGHWVRKSHLKKRLREALLDVFTEERGQTCCLFIAEDHTTVIDLPVRFVEFIMVDNVFLTVPLMALLAQFERLSVLVFDQEDARLFGVYLNDMEALEETFSPYRPPELNTDVPAWLILKNSSVNYRIRDPVQRQLVGVTDWMVRVFKEGGFDRLFIGAPEPFQTAIRDHLPDTLRGRLGGTFSGDTFDSPATIYSKVWLAIEAYQKRREKRMLAELRGADQRSGTGKK